MYKQVDIILKASMTVLKYSFNLELLFDCDVLCLEASWRGLLTKATSKRQCKQAELGGFLVVLHCK